MSTLKKILTFTVSLLLFTESGHTTLTSDQLDDIITCSKEVPSLDFFYLPKKVTEATIDWFPEKETKHSLGLSSYKTSEDFYSSILKFLPHIYKGYTPTDLVEAAVSCLQDCTKLWEKSSYNSTTLLKIDATGKICFFLRVHHGDQLLPPIKAFLKKAHSTFHKNCVGASERPIPLKRFKSENPWNPPEEDPDYQAFKKSANFLSLAREVVYAPTLSHSVSKGEALSQMDDDELIRFAYLCTISQESSVVPSSVDPTFLTEEINFYEKKSKELNDHSLSKKLLDEKAFVQYIQFFTGYFDRVKKRDQKEDEKIIILEEFHSNLDEKVISEKSHQEKGTQMMPEKDYQGLYLDERYPDFQEVPFWKY